MLRTGFLVALLALMTLAVQAAPGHMVLINGHNMMSLHAFSHRFGATVGYDTDRGAITVSRDVHTVELIPYSNIAWVDGNQVEMKNPVVIYDDVTYVPVHFMCRAFGMNCTWSPDNRQLIILLGGVSITFMRDDSWAQRRHVIQRNFDFHVYQNFEQQPRPHHGPTPPPPPQGGPRPGHQPRPAGTQNAPAMHPQHQGGKQNAPAMHPQHPARCTRRPGASAAERPCRCPTEPASAC